MWARKGNVGVNNYYKGSDWKMTSLKRSMKVSFSVVLWERVTSFFVEWLSTEHAEYRDSCKMRALSTDVACVNNDPTSSSPDVLSPTWESLHFFIFMIGLRRNSFAKEEITIIKSSLFTVCENTCLDCKSTDSICSMHPCI